MNNLLYMVSDDFGPAIPADVAIDVVNNTYDAKVKELHKMINCSIFGMPASEAMRAHKLLDEIVLELKNAK